MLLSLWQHFCVLDGPLYVLILDIEIYRRHDGQDKEHIDAIRQSCTDLNSTSLMYCRHHSFTRPAEEWARQVAEPWSNSNGASIILPLLACVLLLLLLAFTDHASIPPQDVADLSSNSTEAKVISDSNAPPHVPRQRFVGIFAVLCASWSMYLFIKNLNHFSNPNRAWNRQVELQLNDGDLESDQ